MVGIILVVIISLVVVVLLALEIIGLVRDVRKRKKAKMNQNKSIENNDNK